MRSNKILAISVDEYNDPGLNRLVNCKTDVDKIIAVLDDRYSFSEIVTIYKKENTTRKSLMIFLQDYFLNILSDENCLIIFTGHGAYNDKLKAGYWQPSDSDPNDFSTWINVDEIKVMIKASEAFHISIISDSCFSGSIFQTNYRGGGVDAYNKHQSRSALTSGSIEKVKDGKIGDTSPFAKTVLEVLVKNELDNMTFTQFSSQVITQFSHSENQTPRFGNLVDCGHEGGDFVFSRKNSGEVNSMEYIKEILSNKFIPFGNFDEKVINELAIIQDEKRNAIESRDYKKAADLRDSESEKISKIYNQIPDFIESLMSKTIIPENMITSAKERDEKFAIFEIERQKHFIKKKKSTNKSITENKIRTIYPLDVIYSSDTYYMEYLLKGLKPKLFEEFCKNILSLASYFVIVLGETSNETLLNRRKELVDILVSIYKFQVDLLLKDNGDRLSHSLVVAEFELVLLRWIDK